MKDLGAAQAFPGSGMMAAHPTPHCPRMDNLTPEALAQVAAYFQALSEPARLRLLNLLRTQRHSVGELADATGYSPANVSRHLALLAQHGVLARETQGTSVYYTIADPAIYELCNLVCDNLARRFERTAAHREAFAPARAAPRATGSAKSAAKNPAKSATKPSTRTGATRSR
jgi:DNA-binding transcriptional ArsR family regulator